uniref:Uncharacterized protein n=1 Tax=candidate division WOR-3 bacterium TaxID=2052148 RepID=A0A7C4TI48_UNCW3
MNWNTMTLNVHLPNSSFARDSLKKEFYQLPYDGQQTIGDFLGTDFNRWRRIEEIINEDISIGQYYLTDGGLEFSAQMKIGSKVLSLLIPEAKPVKLIVPMLCPCCGQEWPKDKPVPPGLELIPKEVESIEYTGIIIDCRGLKFNPTLFPKIYNEVLNEVYSVNFASRGAIIDNGLVLYTTEEIYNHPRIGYNPLRIRALGTTGQRFSDIQISSYDARRIHGSKKNLNLLKECRVAIIFSP